MLQVFSSTVLSILSWRKVTIFTVCGFLIWFQSGLRGSRFLPTFVHDEKPCWAWWHLILLLKHSPSPSVYLLPLGKYQNTLPTVQNKILAGKETPTSILKKGHEKWKKQLAKPLQLFSFHMGPPLMWGQAWDTLFNLVGQPEVGKSS